MPTLTRRRDPDAPQETWHIHYGDVQVGMIGSRAGVPADADRWGWVVGLASRRARERDRQELRCGARHRRGGVAVAPAQRHGSRLHRISAAPRARHVEACHVGSGLGAATQVADGRSTCFCGAAIGIADVEQHVLAAHMHV